MASWCVQCACGLCAVLCCHLDTLVMFLASFPYLQTVDGAGPQAKVSLLDQHAELKKQAEVQKETEWDKQIAEEEEIFKNITETRALMGAGELAKGVVYSESLQTG